MPAEYAYIIPQIARKCNIFRAIVNFTCVAWIIGLIFVPLYKKKDENMKDDIRKLEHQLSELKSDRKNLARNDARIRALQERIDAANMIAGANANAKKRRR